MINGKHYALAAVLALSFAPCSARAQDGAVKIETCANADNPHFAADEKVVGDTLTAFGNGGYRELAKRLDGLRAVSDDAPPCFPEIEQRGPKRIVVRAFEHDQSLVLALLVAKAADGLTVDTETNTYPLADFLLGSYANENQNFADGLKWLDRGLTLQPRNQILLAEKVASLVGLHRPADAVAVAKGALEDPALALTLDRARFERIMGSALIDLDRLDDAEAALKESIRIEPNNPGAQHELDYIASVRAGAKREDGIVPPKEKKS